MDEETDDSYELSEDAEAGLAQWQRASSFQELCELMACFIEGTCKYSPGDRGETPGEESQPLIEYLAALNRAGFLTDCSQPGLDLGHSKQRAFVTGYASEAVAVQIEKLSLTTDLYVSISRPGYSNGCRMPVTIDVFKAFTWAGEAAIDEEEGYFEKLVSFEEDCGPLAFQELRQACYINVIDLCWGRKDYLWEQLAKALCFSLE